VTDASDYTIPVHGEQRKLPHVAIEIRQDLIADALGQLCWYDCIRKPISGSSTPGSPNKTGRLYRAISAIPLVS
jgi:predicted N-formylglutamate amidohydrolase